MYADRDMTVANRLSYSETPSGSWWGGNLYPIVCWPESYQDRQNQALYGRQLFDLGSETDSSFINGFPVYGRILEKNLTLGCYVTPVGDRLSNKNVRPGLNMPETSKDNIGLQIKFWKGISWANITASSSFGDLNGDGCVDAADLTTFIARWGTPDAAADFNNDGTVAGEDLATLLGNMVSSCP